MGCEGAGKSSWKRGNYDRLPDRFIEPAAVAGGFGDRNDTANRNRCWSKIFAEIDLCFEKRLDFGIETSFGGSFGTSMLERAIEHGYRIEGIYFCTNAPGINVERLKYRELIGYGPRVDLASVPHLYDLSLANLRKHWSQFDQLELFDNSTEDDLLHLPQPVQQCTVLDGKRYERIDPENLSPWYQKLITLPS